ncbi:2-hydroxyacid dehydrogenase [Echinimonas agarilytica]|uniref:2-hydroxyacid dehydrogenase n=1 Tax=Echinimonas agarilytica TaxID=1215918 RepID=A0AA42B6L9_9GAMM|nr:2-hydroxyacid dehydrogenase [Echinimonas agarilytica]MCM2678849.1 2-hydroxyacid dehydrogenase [Echinimonas agarilytica]
MKVAVFSARSYEIRHFEQLEANYPVELVFFDTQLNLHTAKLATGCKAVCAFVNDDLSAPVIEELVLLGVSTIAMRCAGFNNVDLDQAKACDVSIVRVPAYSPEAVAEHAVALMMTLNRRIHKAYQRTRDANFALEGLVGFNMHGKVVGVVGTGKIGIATLRILKGFGCQLLAYDPYENQHAIDLGAEYTSLDDIFSRADVITLHCPLTADNRHLLDDQAFSKMKDKVMVINTSRGPLVDAVAAIQALKNGKIGALGLDVYEEEEHLFFGDHSNEVIEDDVFRRLSACHNVIFTGHQAFLTEEALSNIAQTTLENLAAISNNRDSGNEVR